jgi:ribA/ribD-fused uncharacterized protein
MMDLPTDRDSLQNAVRAGRSFGYVYFWGHRKSHDGAITKSCFSQWYDARFRIGDELFKTAEHYMMVCKARLFGDNEAARAILRAVGPNEAKTLGRRVRGFSESTWLTHREEIVYRGNLAKFAQNSSLRAFLLATRGSILVEASPVDPIWGIGLSQEDPRAADVNSWPGLNLLGFALTKVREELESGQPFDQR